MLAIGRALMARPRLILLDEPSLGLAPKLMEQIFRILDDIRDLVKERKLTRIASCSQDDEYGLDGHLAGKARLKHHGTEYIAEVDYKRADIDFSSQAAKLKESGAEAVILQAIYCEPPWLAKQCHATGYNPLCIGPSPIVLDNTIELGGKHAEDVIGVEVWPPPTDPGPFLDQYRADMQKYFPQMLLDMTNLYGYQKAALFVEALQRTVGVELPRMVEILASQVVSGLATGCVYALVALGFVLIYGATEAVNFA